MHVTRHIQQPPAAPGHGPRALLLDALGTLVSLAPPAPALRDELARRFGIVVSERDAERALAAEIGFYRAHMGLGRDVDSLASLRHRCAEVLRDALPPRDGIRRLETGALTDALLGALRFAAFPDARPALIEARVRGARVIVVSNWDISLIEVLERIGLAPLLDGVVTSAAIGAAKPAPEIFRHALALAGVAPEAAVHVGDSLSEDLEGARACGIPAVLVRRSGEPGPPGVTTITGLAELVNT
jgi:putative hydrolase of the HAD superfamily